MTSRKTGLTANLDTLDSIDIYRIFVFPNHVRKYRKSSKAGSLLQLAQKIRSTTYIRLSKIERGEIFARTDELHAIAAALGVLPEQLLIDIDDPQFDMAQWASDFLTPDSVDMMAETMAVLIGAAVRHRRAADETLTIAAIEKDYGIAPVILSRIENAFKPFDRWSQDIQQAVFAFFGVADADALTKLVTETRDSGALAPFLPLVANPNSRIEKTRTKVLALRAELAKPAPRPRQPSNKVVDTVEAPQATPISALPQDVLDVIHAADTATVRLLPVFGAPLPDGLVARTATGEQVEAPRNAGPRAYGLRVCRPSLGPGLPGRTIVVVDPDRFPSAGGLAVIREGDGLRLLSITFDRQGKMLGYSENPDREILIDDLAPGDVSTVLSAHFE